jgi:RNA polymerase sigma-70 factor (ECF subfamily)
MSENSELGRHREKQKEFENLAFAHMDSLFNTALRMTRNTLDAEDLLQDVYVRAFRFFHRFEKETNFKAWIFKILTNTYINQYRKKLKQPQEVQLDKVIYNQSKGTTDAHRQVIESFDTSGYHHLFDDQIIAALSELNDDFRMVVLLADVESFSYKEIAKMLDCPIGTVMSRLSRARKYLQDQLRDYAIKGGFLK